MRNRYSMLNLMRHAIGAALVAVPVVLQAQVALYSFSESAGTYAAISASDGGVSLGVPAYWPHVNNNRAWVNNPFNDPDGQVTASGYLNPASGPGYPIGFDFTFNGDVFDVIGISNGGWVSFGKSSDGLQAVWVYNWSGTPNGDPFTQWYNTPAESYKRNRVAGFGNSSLQMVDWTSLVPPGSYSNLQVATIGTAPNRVCVIQWKDFGLRNDVTVAMNKINFQIRLNESDNSVEVVFGPMNWVSSLGRYRPTQIGLSGRTNEDYNGRMTEYSEPAFLYDWNNTIPANSNIASEASCLFTAPQPGNPNGAGIAPVEGLTWRWVAPVCPPPTWPLAVGNITFASAIATWEPFVPGEYEYVVTAVNDVNAPAIISGTTTDPEIPMEGLEALTEYYIFVRAICDGEPGTWSWATNFKTLGGGVVECDGTALVETYCSHQNDTIQWLYVSELGSALKIEFLGGFVGTISGGGSLRIWDGGAPVGAANFTAPTGDITGQYFTATEANGGQLFMQLITDNGSCESQDWYLPLEWRIGCKDCPDPLANFSVVDDCDNLEYSVVVNVGAMGGVPTLRIDNTLGLAPMVISTIGQHTVGPFPTGQSVVITLQNPDNDLCYVASPPMIGQPCAIVGCGPTTVTHCYGNNENRTWAYQAEGSQEIGIRFIQGGRGLGDIVKYYNGLDIDMLGSTNITVGDLRNTLIVSAAPSTDQALVLELVSDNMHSCADPDPFYGVSEEWEFVVACYDGCTQPRASFTSVCVDQTHFNVEVNITELGNTPSVSITNNAGAAAVTATATGAYTVGPFISGTPATIEVVGASILCTWTSGPQNRDCIDIGIAEAAMSTMALFPNPNDGHFTLELPEGLNGTSELQVLDLAGRVVAQQRLVGTTTQQFDLSALPNGWYTLLLRNNGRTNNGKVSIQH